jgi:hypothetical protein
MSINSIISRSRVFSFCLLSFCAAALFGQESSGISIVAEMTFTDEYLQKVDVELLCGPGELKRKRFEMGSAELLELPLEVSAGARASCQLLASPPEGYTASYQVQGEGAYKADRNGCQFSRIEPGQGNSCQIEISQDPVRITVYKEWIGASGEELDVRVSLSCESGDYSGERYVNEGSPDGWEINNIDPEGVLCNVSETVRDTFSPDIIDCQGLLILPGKGEECTLVNTKIVKRIEMLNRYGKIVMILLVLAVGLAAMKRMS